jgi:hypothetical protein
MKHTWLDEIMMEAPATAKDKGRGVGAKRSEA